MKKILNGQEITLGTCYYPEHWDRSLWEEDLRRMLDAGLRTIRVGEFAWNLTEPSEGVYVYDFWEDFLNLCEKYGMQVIFCTPTATPPAWLTEKYPEVLNRDIDGHVICHGQRQQNNFSSPVYRRFSRVITEKLAAHFGKHPAIIGWQLDNEFNCGSRTYFAESDSIAFREFLKNRYGTLDALNKAWGTVFWNQTYTAWEEVFVPRKTNSSSWNPHLLLDYKRYVSDIVSSFAKEQADIIKKYKKPDDFITTNGLFDNLDYNALMEGTLDDITYDSYPDFAYTIGGYEEKGMKDRHWSKNLMRTRMIKEPFGIMEQQSGAPGWYNTMMGPTPRPGQLRLWTMQSVAHGADYVSYFRWRTATFGTEIYWHGILDYSGRDNRRLREVKEVRDDFVKISEIAGALYEAEIGVLQDYDNTFDADVDKWHQMIERQSSEAIFNALEKSHTPYSLVDFRDTTEVSALLRYKVLFYPHPEILTPERVRTLTEYVRRGGRLILGARTGQKDLSGICTMEKLPGLLQPLSGADVLEYTIVAPDEGKVTATWDDVTFETPLFNETLSALDDAEVLARYNGTYYEGEPALLRKQEGSGEVYYFGSAFSEEAVLAFSRKLGVLSPLDSVVSVPSTVELAVRSKDGVRYLFLLNYLKEPKETVFHAPVTDMLTGSILSGSVTLPAYGVMIVKM